MFSRHIRLIAAKPWPPEVMVDGDRYYVVRTRETVDDLLRGESIPEALDA